MQYRLMIKNEKTEYPRIENNLPPYPDEGKQHHLNDHSLLCYSFGNLCSFPLLAPSGKAFPVDVLQTTSKDFEGMGAYNLPPYPDVKASCIISTAILCYAVPLGTSAPFRSLPLWEGFPR